MLSNLCKMWHNRIIQLWGIRCVWYSIAPFPDSGMAKQFGMINRKDVDYNEGFSY